MLNMNNPKNEMSAEAITLALFENYESIYDIDVETSAYQCYHESDSYSELEIAESGEDFFSALSANVPKVVHPEDVAYVLRMLERERLLSALDKEKYYSFVYRLMIGGKAAYHKIRITMGDICGRPHFLLGIRDVDETVRQEQAHTEALAFLQQKEKNHLEAILASAAGYLEVNLTRDTVLEQSPNLPSGQKGSGVQIPQTKAFSSYSLLNQWLCTHQIVERADRYARISSREYLLACFARGERRASVFFSARRQNGDAQPCREVFYLYRDDATGDVMSFCVIYDLTEQQRRDKELSDLEHALQMSRIRNFTSQMQPHFLYNALGSIQEIILDDPEYASELVGDFTVHLRSCIRAMSEDAPLPFEQELSNIRAYVNIEKMRFGKKLKVVYDVPVTAFRILPLSIQPLVENSIRHGIYQRGPAGGTVTIRSRELPDEWLVEVEDDGVGFDPARLAQGAAAGTKDSTGLNNLIFRLEAVMHAQVHIHSVPGRGTTVSVSIPKGGTS